MSILCLLSYTEHSTICSVPGRGHSAVFCLVNKKFFPGEHPYGRLKGSPLITARAREVTAHGYTKNWCVSYLLAGLCSLKIAWILF